ncbi:MAG TPA: serine protease [Candidatus Acidoferrum sp.]
MAAAVWVEKLDAAGNTLQRSSGFVVKDARVATSFRSIDGATSLKLIFADGKEFRTSKVAGFNRYQDWALIPIDDKSSPALQVLSSKTWKTGAHVSWLDVKPDGTRAFVEGEIASLQSTPPWGDRITISGKFSYAALGGPLLDTQGRVIGVLGGALPDAFVRIADLSAPATDPDDVYQGVPGTAVPGNLIPQTLLALPRELKILWDNGDMTVPRTNSKYVASGMMSVGSKESKKKAGEHVAKVDFKKSDASAIVVLSFDKSEAVKTTAQIKLYDFENHPVAAGEVEKISIKKGSGAEQNWDVPVAQLPAGIYRVDILVGDGVAWRQYFRIAD